MIPNKSIQNLKPYLSIPHKIWEMGEQKDCLKLDWNEATIPPSPKVQEDIIDFLKYGHMNWYPNTKNITLFKKLSHYVTQPASCIELFNGSDAAHECIIDVFLEKIDRVGIVSPTYDNFRARANGAGIESVIFPLNQEFDLDFESLNLFLKKENIKMLYICNPNNPTGKAYCQQKLESIIKVHPNILFLVDEAYYEFCGKSVCHLIAECKNLIITRTFSKAFALACFRIGYCISNEENIKAINKLRNPKSVAMFSQLAANAALDDVEYMHSFVKEVKVARDFFINGLQKLNIQVSTQSEANFVLFQSQYAKELVSYMQSNGIFVRDYTHIIPNACRITIGTQEQMHKVLECIKQFFDK